MALAKKPNAEIDRLLKQAAEIGSVTAFAPAKEWVKHAEKALQKLKELVNRATEDAKKGATAGGLYKV